MKDSINLTPVRISIKNQNTADYGTGILFNLENTGYYLIITCAHCLESAKDKNEILVEIYNNHKFEKLGNESILDYYTEVRNKDSDDNYNFDVGAILIKKEMKLTRGCTNLVRFFTASDEPEYIEAKIQGFPAVLKDDSYTKMVALNGKCIKIIDKTDWSIYKFELSRNLSSTMGSSQKEILEGISGSPLYFEKEGSKFVLGIAKKVQSSKGEDVEFSSIYALKIEYALNKLKEEGLIIYDYNNITGELKIKWIKGYYKEVSYTNSIEKYKEKDILVLGSSGAGKSSFIKTFAEHSNSINSSGDGQTTRSNINYKFSIYEEKPRIELTFLNNKEFVEARLENIRIPLLKYKLYVLGLPEYDIELEPDIAIKTCVGYLIKLKEKIGETNEDKNVSGEDTTKDKINKLIDSWYSIDFLNYETKRDKLLSLTDDLIIILKELKNYFPEGSFKFIFNSSFRKSLISIPEVFNSLRTLLNESNINAENIERNLLNKILECDNSFLQEYNKKIQPHMETLEVDTLKEKLKNILLEQRGFFSYKEFDFIDDGISRKILDKYKDCFNNSLICEIDSEDIKQDRDKEKSTLEGQIRMFYSEIFKVIKEYEDKYKINEFNLRGENIYHTTLDRALKVVDGESISSIISEINVFDSFSSKYSMIMDRLMIKSLTFIDTCGLDHVDNGEIHKEKLNKVFADRNNNIKTIFYVKKLDSGKPTELEKIIPKIYEVQPNAALYCIFNGIDIFYDNTIKKEKIIKWDNKKNMPKAPKYILGDEGENDIKQSMEKQLISKGQRKTIYSTLSKNLVPFCSNLEKSNNYWFESNNKYYVNKLFNSVILEEHLGLELINTTTIEERIETDDFKKELESLLLKLFEKASILDWNQCRYGHGHYRTQDANIREIGNENLGYKKTYDDLWNYKFKEAYSYVFSYEHKDGLNLKKLLGLSKGDNTYDKLESLIIDFRDIFIGCPEHENAIFFTYKSNCYTKESDKICCEKRCFRNIILDMYNKGNFKYSINEKPDKVSRHEYLNDICNFEKGFDSIKDELILYFINEFKKKIKSENEKNIDTILKINPTIGKLFNQLETEINNGFLGATANGNEVIDMVLNKLKKQD